MSTAIEVATEAVQNYVEIVETIKGIEAEIADTFREEVAMIADLRKELAQIEVTMKQALRDCGESSLQVGTHIFKMVAKKSTQVDVELLVEEARKRKHLDTLVSKGFVNYSVDAAQIDRLPNGFKEIYGEFITKVDGTTSVSIPKPLGL